MTLPQPRDLVCGLLIFALAISVHNSHQCMAAVYNPLDYGAKLNNLAQDSRAAFQSAITAAKATPNNLVRLNVTANFMINNTLSFTGAVNLTLDFGGSTLYGNRAFVLFYFTNSESVTIRNLKIDWVFLPFIGGTVLAVNNTGPLRYFDMRVLPPYNASDAIGRNNLAYFTFDVAKNRLADPGLVDVYQTSYTTEYISRPNASDPDVIRCPMSFAFSIPIGSAQLVRHYVYNYNGFSVVNTSNLLLEDVTLYSVPGMGFYCDSCYNTLTLRRFVVTRRPRLWMSTTADATHCNNCRGKVTYTDSYFEGMGDDAVNVHTRNQRVMEVDVASNSFNMSVPVAGSPGTYATGPLLPPGSRFELGIPDDAFTPYATLTVAAADLDTIRKVRTITTVESLPARLAVGDIVSHITSPYVEIRNVSVVNNRARGMLIQTRSGALLDNCKFIGQHLDGIQVTNDVDYWWEGPPSADVTIQNSVFRDVRGVGVKIVSNLSGGRNAPAGSHKHIHVYNNVFENVYSNSVFVGSAQDVIVQGNLFNATRQAPVSVCHSKNVTIAYNSLQDVVDGATVFSSGCNVSWSSAIDNTRAYASPPPLADPPMESPTSLPPIQTPLGSPVSTPVSSEPQPLVSPSPPVAGTAPTNGSQASPSSLISTSATVSIIDAASLLLVSVIACGLSLYHM